jgi:phosphoserine phosphatase
MVKIKLICFDVDGTLVKENSWQFLTAGLGFPSKRVVGLYRRAKSGELTFIEAERKYTKMLQRSGRATRPFIEKLFSQVKPRPGAKELISYLKKKGYPVYLISGAIDIFVEEIAKKIKADGFYANSSLRFDEKGSLEKIHYREMQGELKVEQLKELIKKLRIRMNEVAFVGDSENDIEVFRATGHGIAIHSTNEELKKIAWKTAASLEKIKEIL